MIEMSSSLLKRIESHKLDHLEHPEQHKADKVKQYYLEYREIDRAQHGDKGDHKERLVMDGRQETLRKKDQDGDRKEILRVKPGGAPSQIHPYTKQDSEQHEKELFGIKVERTDIHELNIIKS